MAQLISTTFTIVLIGLAGDYVRTGGSSYLSTSSMASSLTGNYLIKYQLTISQLTIAAVILCSELTYVALYIYVTVAALWQPFHTLDLPHLFRE